MVFSELKIFSFFFQIALMVILASDVDSGVDVKTTGFVTNTLVNVHKTSVHWVVGELAVCLVSSHYYPSMLILWIQHMANKNINCSNFGGMVARDYMINIQGSFLHLFKIQSLKRWWSKKGHNVLWLCGQ